MTLPRLLLAALVSCFAGAVLLLLPAGQLRERAP